MFEHDLKFTILSRILSIVATSVSIMRDISSFVFPLSVGSSYSSSFFPYPSFTFSFFKFPFSPYSQSTPTLLSLPFFHSLPSFFFLFLRRISFSFIIPPLSLACSYRDSSLIYIYVIFRLSGLASPFLHYSLFVSTLIIIILLHMLRLR